MSGCPCKGRDLYADGWEQGRSDGYQQAVEQLLALADLERDHARRMLRQTMAAELHRQRPQLVRTVAL